MSEIVKKDKQKKSLLKIVEKLYKTDLETILVKFYVSKKGPKCELKKRVIDLIDIKNDKQDIDFDKLRKEIKKVYKLNPKIKRSPKKAKSLKNSKTSQPTTAGKTLAERRRELEEWDEWNGVNSNESTSSDAETPPKPILRVPKITISVPPNNQSVNQSRNHLWDNPIPNQHFQPTIGSTEERISESTRLESRQTSDIQTPIAQPFSANTNTTNPTYPPLTPINSQHNLFSNIIAETLAQIQSQRNTFAFSSPTRPPPPTFQSVAQRPPLQLTQVQRQPAPQLTPNSVSNDRLIRPMINPLNGSTQPIDYSLNNYFESSSHKAYIPSNSIRNYFQSVSVPVPLPVTETLQNPATDNLNPAFIDFNSISIIEQQKILLSQFPNSFQEKNKEKTTEESDVSLTDFSFKVLPKYKVFKKLTETKTIGSLTDIGSYVDFNIKVSDLEPNYFETNYLNFDNLKSLLERKTFKVILRFSYVSDMTKEQKDFIPQYLCIECNNKRIYTYEEGTENITGPFDLSDSCNFNENRIRFFMNREKYTYLLPCLYEISIVEFDTCDSFLSKLKSNSLQFLSSDSTINLIKSRSEQLSQDEIISINTDIKLKLICPLSCRRIDLPCRSVDCKHIECFDAYSFFKTNETRYDWICPICQKSAQFDKLRIDEYIVKILDSTDINTTEISIKPDASYDVIEKKSETKIVIEIDDSVPDDSDDEIQILTTIAPPLDSEGCIVLE